MKTDVSIVIVSFNTKNITLDCLKSVVENTRHVNYEIILVDNNSSDGSADAIADLKKKGINVQIIKNNKNVGFAGANNQGIKASSGRYILFLNSDTKIANNVIGQLSAWMDKNKDVGASTVKIVDGKGNLQEAGGYFPTLLSVFSWMTIQDIPFVDLLIKPFHPLKPKSFSKNNKFFSQMRFLDWIIGAFIFARRDSLEEIGGWSEDYFMYTEDVDLCFEIRKKGYKIAYLPTWQIIHLGGSSSVSREFPLLWEYKSIKLFFKKHYPSWQYPILRALLKLGALGRFLVLGILEGKETAKIYAKAFREA